MPLIGLNYNASHWADDTNSIMARLVHYSDILVSAADLANISGHKIFHLLANNERGTRSVCN